MKINRAFIKGTNWALAGLLTFAGFIACVSSKTVTTKPESKVIERPYGLITIAYGSPPVQLKESIMLYIVDGEEVNKEYFQKIAIENIAQFEVLKDSSATAKYGEKGRNGVIIITLKKK